MFDAATIMRRAHASLWGAAGGLSELQAAGRGGEGKARHPT